VSLGHPCKFQRLSHLGSVTAQHSSSGRQPNFAALNRGRRLYSAGRPSRWALAHILVTVNAGLKCAARGSLKIQDAKNRYLSTIPQLCWAISSQLRHESTIGKKLVKQQYLLHMSPQYGELCGSDRFGSLGHPSYFQRR